jgi:hypothetical protein
VTSSVRWSLDVSPADWIGPRLSPFDTAYVTSVVPAGFPAYARVVHPAARGGRRVRWSEIASWSGRPLSPGGQFSDIALPATRPAAPIPWDLPPAEGTMSIDEALTLARLLATDGPAARPWWFAVWDGFGWERAVTVSASTDGRTEPDGGGESTAADPLADPVPGSVRAGPRVELPERTYLLYSGDPDDVAALRLKEQTPNLWWPSDHAWCVATEIDLPWTYVGGAGDLVAAVVDCPDLEATRIDPTVSHWFAPPAWVAEWAGSAAAALLRDGHAALTTGMGSVRARLVQKDSGAEWWLRTECEGVLAGGRRSAGGTWFEQLPTAEQLERVLGRAVVDLVQ